MLNFTTTAIITLGFSFFQSLLYNSEFYNRDSQSISMWITNNDERPFCLSTPRLKEPDVLNLESALTILHRRTRQDEANTANAGLH